MTTTAVSWAWRRRLRLLDAWQAQAKTACACVVILSFLIAVTDHVAVHGVLRDLPPQVLVRTEGGEMIVEFLEPLILGGELRIKFSRRFVTSVHHFGRERFEDGS